MRWRYTETRLFLYLPHFLRTAEHGHRQLQAISRWSTFVPVVSSCSNGHDRGDAVRGTYTCTPEEGRQAMLAHLLHAQESPEVHCAELTL